MQKKDQLNQVNKDQKKDQELRRVGLKATLPRLNILQILETADQHHLLSLIHI